MYLADKDARVQNTIFDKWLPDKVLIYLNDNVKDWRDVTPKQLVNTNQAGSDYYTSLRGAFRAIPKLQEEVKTYMVEMGMDEHDHLDAADGAGEDDDEDSPPYTLKAPLIKQPPEPKNPKPAKRSRREPTDESAAISEGQMQQIVDSTVNAKVPPLEPRFAFKKAEYQKIHSEIFQKKRELKALRKTHDEMLANFLGLANPFADSDWELKTLHFKMSKISF